MILDPVRSRQALTRRVLLFVLTPGIAALVLLAMLRPAAKAQAVPIAAAPAQPFVTAPVSIRPAQPTAPSVSLPVATALAAVSSAASQPTPMLVADVPIVPSPKPLASHHAAALAAAHAHIVGDGSKDVTITLQASRKSASFVMTASRVDMVTAIDPLKRPTLAVFGPELKINGTTLLAGVTDADKPGSLWWSADGALLPTPIYDTAAYHAENHAGRDTNNVVFAFCLPAAAQDVTVEYELPQSVRSSSDGFWPTKIQENAQRTEAQIFAKTGGARVLTAAFPSSLKKANIRIGIASGAWKTVATDTADTLSEPAGYMSTGRDNSNFIFGPPVETKSGLLPAAEVDSTTLTITTDTADDLRVVAINAQGQEVLPIDIGGDSIRTLDQITAHFSLPLAQIKGIRIQTRKFLWIELKDIALQPAR